MLAVRQHRTLGYHWVEILQTRNDRAGDYSLRRAEKVSRKKRLVSSLSRSVLEKFRLLTRSIFVIFLIAFTTQQKLFAFVSCDIINDTLTLREQECRLCILIGRVFIHAVELRVEYSPCTQWQMVFQENKEQRIRYNRWGSLCIQPNLLEVGRD